MKKLSPELLINMTDDIAWEVVGSFADHLEHTQGGFLEFEDVLEYDKNHILVCLLHLLKENLDNKDAVETICSNIAILVLQFIPSPENYQRQLRTKELTDENAK